MNKKKGCEYCGKKVTKYYFDTFFMGKTIIGVCEDLKHREKAKILIDRNINQNMKNAQT